MATSTDTRCPKCSGAPVAIETATALLREPIAVELVLRCGCGVTWPVGDLPLADALELGRELATQQPQIGATQAALGMLLEVSGKPDEAYEQYVDALARSGVFDRAFCWEHRCAHEASHGWLRNALHSCRMALDNDRRASRVRVPNFEASIERLERALREHGIWFPPPDREATNGRWQRELVLERPPGVGERNELGLRLTADVIEVERLLRDARWDDAIAALQRLGSTDFVDAIGYAARGVDRALAMERRDVAIALQALVVQGYVIYASWSTSGAEGMMRTGDVDRERERLRELEGG